MNRTLAATCLLSLACGFTLAAQRPAAPEIAKGKGAIVGRVLDAGTKAPIAGAVVTLIQHLDPSAPPPQGFMTGRFGGSAPRGVITNAEGYFVFGELPAGRYALAAAAFGYLDGGYLMPSLGAPVHLVELDGTETPVTIKISLEQAASISGTVADERGERMPGVPVTAFRRAAGGGAALVRAAQDAFTDDRGVYRIAQLAPGSYIVGVVSTSMTMPAGLATQIDVAAPNPNAAFDVESSLLPGGMLMLNGHLNGAGTRVDRWVVQRAGATPPPGADGRLLAYAPALFPGTAVPSEATTIALRSGEERLNVDVPLRLLPAVSVSGVLTGPAGPMANVVVRLVVPDAISLSDANPGVATAITDANGAFALIGVPAGQYTIAAAYVAMPDRSGRPDAAGTALWVLQPLAVGDADVTGVALAMRPGVRVSGRVEFKGITPPSGAPPVIITLRPLGADIWRTLQGRAGADGTFATGGDPPGRYLVVAASASSSGALVSIGRGGKRLVDDLLELESADVTDLTVTVSNGKTRISGSVVDSNGAADPESNVIAFPADTTLWREGILSDRRFCQTAVTSAAGFECAGLSPGDYFVVSIDAGMRIDRADPSFLERLIPGAARITLAEGDDKKTSLRTFVPRER